MDVTKLWERFFTEQDKAHDEVWGKKQPTGFGANPALILIDIYYGVLGFENRLWSKSNIFRFCRSGRLGGGRPSVELLAAARKNNIPVIHITKLEGSGIIPRSKSRHADAMPEELRRGSAEIVEEVAPQPGEVVIYKSAPSAFQGTVLLFQLRSMGIDTLIACGESTSGCVRATVVDGKTNRFNMGVVAECVFDRTQMSHFVNLYDMHQKYADVIDRFEATAYFEQIAGKKKVAAEV